MLGLIMNNLGRKGGEISGVDMQLQSYNHSWAPAPLPFVWTATKHRIELRLRLIRSSTSPQRTGLLGHSS